MIFYYQESRRIEEVERLDLTGSSHAWNGLVYHTYSGINVSCTTSVIGYHQGHNYYSPTYPISNMFHASKADVGSIFGSDGSNGQLDFDFPTKVFVEYMRIYPYCGQRHSR